MVFSDSDDDIPLSGRANGTLANNSSKPAATMPQPAQAASKPSTASKPSAMPAKANTATGSTQVAPNAAAKPQTDNAKANVVSQKPAGPANGGFSREKFAGQPKAGGSSSDAVARVNNILPKPKPEAANGSSAVPPKPAVPSSNPAEGSAAAKPSTQAPGAKSGPAVQNGIAKPAGPVAPKPAGPSAPKPASAQAQATAPANKSAPAAPKPKTANPKPAAPSQTAQVQTTKPSAPAQNAKPAGAAAAKPSVKRVVMDDSDSEDDLPLNKRVKANTGQAVPKPKAKKPDSSKAANKKPESKDQDSKKRKAEKSSAKASKKAKADDKKAEKKWDDLQHCGVLFPPDYQPHGIKMLYDGKAVDLTPEQEEVAGMYGIMIETDYAKKKQFNDNFWAAFKGVLGKNHVIKSLEKCDFRPMYEHFMAEREAKKALPKEEKVRLKEEKDAAEAKYKTATVDGRREGVGNFRVEPPGLFRGRGEHPKMGQLKRRIFPRDITINIGKGQPIPEHPYPGQKWKEIRHDNTVTWLAFWKDPISTKDFKYVWLAANSTFKSDSDLAKYEKARKLKDYVDGIRERYQKDWKSDDTFKQQMGVALYFIDKLALRAGHEKDEDEADTVGCCTLKVENVEVMEDPANHIKFDFLGKDSIRYENQVEVDPTVWKLVKRFCKKSSVGKSKSGEDQLFETLNATDLNNSLKDLMEGLSVKVFRTYNASITLDRLLFKESTSETIDEKKADYDRANKEVAILCNHQRAVPKGHSDQMERLADKLKTQQDELDQFTLELKVIQGKLAASKLKDPAKKLGTEEQVKNRIVKKKEQLAKLQVQSRSKEDLKTVALGTSKINYLDPRITIAWCKRQEVPIEKIFNKSLLSKFHWAMDAEPEFKF